MRLACFNRGEKLRSLFHLVNTKKSASASFFTTLIVTLANIAKTLSTHYQFVQTQSKRIVSVNNIGFRIFRVRNY